MNSQIIRLTVDAKITFKGEQDRLNAVEYAKHLILTTSGTGVKFVSIAPGHEDPNKCKHEMVDCINGPGKICRKCQWYDE